MKTNANISIRVPTELIRKAQQAKLDCGINWSFEIRKFLERRIEELQGSTTTTAKAQ